MLPTALDKSRYAAPSQSDPRKVEVALDFGNMNLRATLIDSVTGEPLFPAPVKVPVPQADARRTLEEASVIVDRAFEQLLAQLRYVKEHSDDSDVRDAEIEGIFVSTRGPFGDETRVEGVDYGRSDASTTWVARSLAPFEASEDAVRRCLERLAGTEGWGSLPDAEKRKAALNVAVYPLQKKLEEIAARALDRPVSFIPVANDADANLIAALKERHPDGLPALKKKAAMLIVGTGIGFAIHDPISGKKRGQISYKNASTVSISRAWATLKPDDKRYFQDETVPLTKVTAGPFLAEKFDFKPGHTLDQQALRKIIDHELHYLTPIVAAQMKEQGIGVLHVSGGVANELGADFSSALQAELRKDPELRDVECVPPSDMGDQTGLYGAWHIGKEIQQERVLSGRSDL